MRPRARPADRSLSHCAGGTGSQGRQSSPNPLTGVADDYGHTEVLYFNFDSDSALTATQDAGTATNLILHHDGNLLGQVSVLYDQPSVRPGGAGGMVTPARRPALAHPGSRMALSRRRRLTRTPRLCAPGRRPVPRVCA